MEHQVTRCSNCHVLQFCNQAQPQTYFKNCVFISNEEFYLTLTLFLHLVKFHFANNKLLFFTIHSKMWHKIGGNQIPGRGLDVYDMKFEYTSVEMFWFAKMVFFWANIGEKCCEKTNFNAELKNQLIKREFYVGNWVFKAWMQQI